MKKNMVPLVYKGWMSGGTKRQLDLEPWAHRSAARLLLGAAREHADPARASRRAGPGGRRGHVRVGLEGVVRLGHLSFSRIVVSERERRSPKTTLNSLFLRFLQEPWVLPKIYQNS